MIGQVKMNAMKKNLTSQGTAAVLKTGVRKGVFEEMPCEQRLQGSRPTRQLPGEECLRWRNSKSPKVGGTDVFPELQWSWCRWSQVRKRMWGRQQGSRILQGFTEHSKILFGILFSDRSMFLPSCARHCEWFHVTFMGKKPNNTKPQALGC